MRIAGAKMNSAHVGFLITSPYPCLFLVSGLYLSNHLQYFNDTLKDRRTGQCRVSHARMTTLLEFIF